MINCGTCRFHDSFGGACCNGLSPKVADFTDNDDFCNEWERLDDGCREDVRDHDDDGESCK